MRTTTSPDSQCQIDDIDPGLRELPRIPQQSHIQPVNVTV
jgi:hypothetical protein